MYKISSAIYETMAKHLSEQIGSLDYFSGVVEFSSVDSDQHEVECRVVASLIIYHTVDSMPDITQEVISNIVPVWIECHTFVETEEEINYFDISELKNYLCAW